MKLTCIIVDDEPHALEVLHGFINMTPGLELLGSYTNPLKALASIQTDNQPAIAFLDVDMPGMNGLDLAAKFGNTTSIVFTTSFREYAADAYEQAAADYLLKPIAYERFLRCISRTTERRELAAGPPLIFIKDVLKNATVGVNLADIIYISAALHYIELHTVSERVMAYSGLEAIAKELPDCFCRIHRSFIVNINHIQSTSSTVVTMTSDYRLPVSRTYQKKLKVSLRNIN